jgi:hypothetical protein
MRGICASGFAAGRRPPRRQARVGADGRARTERGRPSTAEHSSRTRPRPHRACLEAGRLRRAGGGRRAAFAPEGGGGRRRARVTTSGRPLPSLHSACGFVLGLAGGRYPLAAPHPPACARAHGAGRRSRARPFWQRAGAHSLARAGACAALPRAAALRRARGGSPLAPSFGVSLDRGGLDTRESCADSGPSGLKNFDPDDHGLHSITTQDFSLFLSR